MIKKKKKSVSFGRIFLVLLTKVESGSWSGEMSPIEVEGKNLGQW